MCRRNKSFSSCHQRCKLRLLLFAIKKKKPQTTLRGVALFCISKPLPPATSFFFGSKPPAVANWSDLRGQLNRIARNSSAVGRFSGSQQLTPSAQPTPPGRRRLQDAALRSFQTDWSTATTVKRTTTSPRTNRLPGNGKNCCPDETQDLKPNWHQMSWHGESCISLAWRADYFGGVSSILPVMTAIK